MFHICSIVVRFSWIRLVFLLLFSYLLVWLVQFVYPFTQAHSLSFHSFLNRFDNDNSSNKLHSKQHFHLIQYINVYCRPHVLGVVRTFAHFSLHIQNRKTNFPRCFFCFLFIRLQAHHVSLFLFYALYIFRSHTYTLTYAQPCVTFSRLFVFTIIISFRFVYMQIVLKFLLSHFLVAGFFFSCSNI